MPNRRLRALVVGSGHRVRNAFLPALSCLDSEIDVVGIHSRTPANAGRVAAQWGVEAVDNLAELRPGDIDLVLVSVTVTSNIAVLKAIAHLAPGAALVIDTPVLGRISDLGRLALYRRWSRVRVAEDFMNMPQFRLVGTAIASGALGDATKIFMSRMGYRYHALALLRSWLDFAWPRFARSRRTSEGVDIEYRFPGNKFAEVREPYEREQGFFSVIGDRGLITGHPMGYELADDDVAVSMHSDNVIPRGRLTRLEDNDGIAGFRIDGFATPIDVTVPHLARLRAMDLEDDSEFNLLRVVGLCNVIRSLWEPDPVNSHYRVESAMADLTVSGVARLSRFPVQRPRERVQNSL